MEEKGVVGVICVRGWEGGNMSNFIGMFCMFVGVIRLIVVGFLVAVAVVVDVGGFVVVVEDVVVDDDVVVGCVNSLVKTVIVELLLGVITGDGLDSSIVSMVFNRSIILGKGGNGMSWMEKFLCHCNIIAGVRRGASVEFTSIGL